MLDISFSELLLCFVVALVVLGPERLPGLARGIGRWTGKARSYMRNLSAELDRESTVAEFRQQIGDAKRILNEESAAMKKSFDDAAAEGRAIVGEARRQVEPEPLHAGLHPDPAPASEPAALPSTSQHPKPPPVDAEPHV
jgi:sec-independent protein translocase protein TatB